MATSYVEKFTDDITARIMADPDKYIISGRDDEIEKVIASLIRRTKNSPVLLGEPGVGKSAVIDGFTKAIMQEEVHGLFKGVHVVSLNVASLIGERFTENLDALLHELTEKREKYILFIDELHMIMGAGDKTGSVDVGNILKPALARGDFRVIGATTTDEYHDYVEKDGALDRRFQPIKIEEPSIDQTILMLTNLKTVNEKYYGMIIEQEAIITAVEKSVRYLTDRFLPDKAIDLLDGAAAKAMIAHKKVLTSTDVLLQLQEITGVPVTSLTKTSAERGLELPNILGKRVLGQQRAINSVSRAIRSYLVNQNEVGKPIANLLFIGSTGVGKTELVKAITEALFDSEENMIRFDMSEFSQESASERFTDRVTRAIKNNPYSVVLFDEFEKAHSSVFDLMLQVMQDGVLTDSRGKSRTFKEALLILTSNSAYKLINDQENLIGLTQEDFGHEEKEFMTNVITELKTKYRPELINRLDEIVVFNQLNQTIVHAITALQLSQYQAMIERENHWELDYTEELVDYIAVEGFDPANGARPIKRAINLKLKDPISKLILKKQLSHPNQNYRIVVDLEDAESTNSRYDDRKLIFYLVKIK